MALHETCYSRKAWLILIAIIIILRSIPHYQFDIFQNPVPTNPPSASTSTTSRQLTLVGPPITLHPSPGAQTYPRAIKLRSGVFLGVVTTFEPQNGILVSISNDSGASWSPHSTIMLAPEPNVQLNNAFLLETSTNRILCAFRCHTLKPEAIGVDEKPGGLNEGYLYYKLLLYYSDDLGITWHYLSTPVQESGPVHGLWEPFLRLSNKGDLQFYYSREAGNRDQDNLLRISKDGGLTWSTEVFVSGSGLATRDGMMGIQELEAGSGKLMSVFESVEEKGDSFEGRFSLWNTFSSDDGHSWGYRRLLYESYWNKPTEHSISMCHSPSTTSSTISKVIH
jgi:Neuraminidase (sialidase)